MASSSRKMQLLRRAQRLAQVRHANLMPMIQLAGGAGLVPASNQGRRLSDFTPASTFKRSTLEQVVRLCLDVLGGLAVLHEDVEDGAGFVHGEVSPQHIFMSSDETARLVPVLPRHWAPKTLPLSNGYTAPELLMGDRGDARADVFSVGAMLWEALAGAPLCPDTSLDAVLDRLLRSQLPSLVLPAGSGAAALCAVAERAIAVDRRQRFQTALDMSRAIEAAMAARLVAQAEAQAALVQPAPPRLPPPLRSITPFSSSLNVKPEAPEELESSSEPRTLTGKVLPLPRRGAWLLLGGVAAVAVVLALAWLAPRPYRDANAAAASLPAVAATPLVAGAVSRDAVPELAPASLASAAALPAAASAAPAAPKPRLRKRDARPRSNDYGI